MQPEYIEVQKSLIENGFGDRAMSDRGDLMDTLRLIRGEHEKNADFVDAMRDLMEAGGRREDESEILRKFGLETGIKGCRQCGKAPRVNVILSPPYPLAVINCEYCPNAKVRASTFAAALVEWNNPEECPDTVEIESRPLYPIPPQCVASL
ncbi:hypothetical protein YA0783_25025 [Pseudomonas corrugata]|uniref:hypothetical protein n=1 Tax=Pseudomonas corrugata TaxID=47879 RepID=UPI0018E5DCDE|nr:hypothetical protein [Pseudomonas corrugata]MBI6621554.1 hypothetical protein [Pseudomonas corrugata]MBI6694211.1 hypothetical protein [Pseudomonas corrugata]